MNLKKKMLIVIPIMLIVAFIAGLQAKALAVVDETRYFGISVIRTRTQEGLGYAIGNPVTGAGSAAMIWNIREYPQASASSPKTPQNALYCLRAGFGFPDAAGDIDTYNKGYDMVKERQEISALGQGRDQSIYSGLVNGGHYNEILAMLDLMYIPNETSAAKKESLLEAAKIYDDEWDYALTDDDIEVAQQAALWYFTNSDNTSIYDKTNTDSWLFYTQDESGKGTFSSFTDYGVAPRQQEKQGYQRNEQIKLLYKYLIKTATANKDNYKDANAKTSKTMTLWTSTTNDNEQPIVEIHEKPEEEKIADLALRKYISNVTGSTFSQGPRKPTITDTNKIGENESKTDHTATYSHRKDPVTVKENDIIEYTIKVYNEGTIEGRAKQIIDQLPTGLQYENGSVTGDYDASYDSASNKITFTKKTIENLAAYSGSGEPASNTITIRCKVVATEKEQKQVLTNVAWISQDEFAETATDVDSSPSSSPSVNANGLVSDNENDYKGHNSNPDVSANNNYWKGQQDDDDFEKVVIPEKVPEKFADLALRKYITGITTGSQFTQGPRTPTITDTNKIGENENRTDHTATYSHRKDPVTVKENDVIEYTIAVYNEGNVAGRAKQIVDQLPTGLEYVEGSATGDYKVDAGGYDKATNKLTLTKVNDNNIAAYSGNGQPTSNTVTIKCKVVATEEEQKQVLTNVVWISDDEFEGGETDIDSSPSSSPSVNADGLVNENKDQYKGNESNGPVTDQNDYWKGQQDDDDFEKVVIPGKEPEEVADLALRKHITKVNGKNVDVPRTPDPETSGLASGSDTTATYNHRKNPVEVNIGDIVTFTITIYNEGDIEGKALEVTDQLPAGMVLVDYEGEEPYDHENHGNGKKFTDNYYWVSEYDEATNKIIFEDQPSIDERPSNWNPSPNLQPYSGSGDPDSVTFEYKCKVTGDITGGADGKVLTNVAWISKDFFTTEDVTDRDSQPTNTPQVNKDGLVSTDPDSYKGNDSNDSVMPGDSNKYWKGKQDDDDFEKVIIPEKDLPFDLKLIKRITEINGETQTERIENIDTSKLNNGKEDEETTADYQLNKDPIVVKAGDVVKYTFRVYNEGYIDGYATKITEDIPEGLEFLWSDKESEEDLKAEGYSDEEIKAIQFNQEIGWTYDEGSNLKTISTDYLANQLIKAFGENPDGTKEFTEENYKEVSVCFKVKDDAPTGEILRNEAEISEHDDDGNPDTPAPTDRDSKPDEWVKYEDDEDYDNVILDSFDLALRKFITGVNDKEITGREPIVDTSKLNTKDENGKMVTTAEYKHPKDPVLVTIGDEVIYTLRVYNEGDKDGYAAEIKDHLPEYLEFIDNDFNEQYGWTVSEDGKTVTTDYLKDQLIKKAEKNENGEIVLSYKDVQIMCKVKNTVQSNYKITNIADITKYEDDQHNPAVDRDSEEDNVDPQTEENKPGYKDDETGEYIPGQEDDDDFEKVIVKIFDLALRKWVSEVIVTEDGVTTSTPTGHQPYDDPEQTVKVDLNRKKLNSTVVKFKYGIRVVNEGEVEGYALEVKDYIPQGLEMKPEDNPLWEYLGDNIAVTDQLKDTLLQPGEYADIEIVLTWINNENDLGLKVNTAEISEDYNEYGLPDVDSIPDNGQPAEDDIDDAPVILSITTGRMPLYIGLGATVLGMLAGGIFLIKKYVIK